jgi:hypothetical protein
VAAVHRWCKDVENCDENSCSLCESVFKAATKAVEEKFSTHNNARAETATKNCEGCRNWKHGRRWGLYCTTCIRNVEKVIDNFNVAASPVA